MEPITNTPHLLVVQPTHVRLLDEDDSGRLLHAEFSYDRIDPYAVTLTFADESGPIQCCFARELLSDGVREPSGDGDVHVFPGEWDGHQIVMIELDDADGDLLLAVSVAEVETFLAMSHDLVPPGEEFRHLDLDAVIAALLDPQVADD